MKDSDLFYTNGKGVRRMKSWKNRVRRNQYWIKKDTGQIIQIKRKGENSSWVTLRMGKGGSLNKAHTIAEHDILRYYDQVVYEKTTGNFIQLKNL